jgi:pyrroloquinoline quinone biosynthesis protein E
MSAVVQPGTALPGPPLWLLLELTYRCPLHCVFCYNPLDFERIDRELDTGQWLRVLEEARGLGAVQLGLSGGEPLARDDLEIIVAEAHRLGFYINLITSGVGLNESRIAALKAAGLDHIQLSFQDSSRKMNDFLSSTRTFELKSKVAALIKEYDYPMVLNVVLHRLNIDHIDEILQMADRLGADYVELANTQYYGWAWHNREQLMPSRAQLQHAEATVKRFRERAGRPMQIYYVVPDYFERRPKPCMNGLGSIFLTVTPDGTALPCHAARMLPGLVFPNVTTASMREVWYESTGFTSSIFSAQTNSSRLRTLSGMSSRSRRLRAGRITVRMPAREAATHFSLMPPTGSTTPRRLISPVMATSAHRALSQQRGQRGRHRDARARAVLRDGACRHVDVQVGIVVERCAGSMPSARPGTSPA